jgi:hypothetical protein
MKLLLLLMLRNRLMPPRPPLMSLKMPLMMLLLPLPPLRMLTTRTWLMPPLSMPLLLRLLLTLLLSSLPMPLKMLSLKRLETAHHRKTTGPLAMLISLVMLRSLSASPTTTFSFR